MPAEIELKLAFDPGSAAAAAAAILAHPAVAAARAGRARTTRLVSTYFDTPDWQLAKAGIALRIRHDGRRWLQTVKGPPLAGAGGALHARDEYEWAIAGPALDGARFTATPWQRPLARARASGALAPRFTTDFERRTLPLAFSATARAELAIDVGEIRAPRAAAGARKSRVVRVPIAEVEIEATAGDAAPLFGLARALAATVPLAIGAADKAARGRALARGEPDGWDRPVHAANVALAAIASTTDALAVIVGECLRQIAGNAAGLTHDADPEWVHQMRVGTRRLRSCLGLVARFAPKEALAPLVAETRWLATTLGRARNVNVFATETLPAAYNRYMEDAAARDREREGTRGDRASARGDGIAPSANAGFDGVADTVARGLAFRRLRERVARRRRSARAAARAAVGSPRFAALLLAVGERAATPRFGAPAAASADADLAAKPARAFACELLARRHRKLEERAHAAAHGDAAARHALRIAAKKQRYAAEFFAPLFAGRRVRSYIAALALLQEVLGRGNDIATAARLAAELGVAGDDPAAVALHQWLGAGAARVERDLARACGRFAGAKHFWQ